MTLLLFFVNHGKNAVLRSFFSPKCIKKWAKTPCSNCKQCPPSDPFPLFSRSKSNEINQVKDGKGVKFSQKRQLMMKCFVKGFMNLEENKCICMSFRVRRIVKKADE